METMYWQIEKYFGSVINLMAEDPRIYSEKLTKKTSGGLFRTEIKGSKIIRKPRNNSKRNGAC